MNTVMHAGRLYPLPAVRKRHGAGAGNAYARRPILDRRQYSRPNFRVRRWHPARMPHVTRSGDRKPGYCTI